MAYNGGGRPHTRIVGQGLTAYCGYFVTVFLTRLLVMARPETTLQFVFNP